MSSDSETVAEIASEMREDWAMVYFSEGTKKKNGEYSNVAAIEPQKVADRIKAANKRELAAKDAEIARLTNIINTECNKCGDCDKFGNDCDAGDVDGNEDCRACDKFISKETAAKDAEIARLKAYIAENDINGDTAVACLTEIKEAAEEKMAEIEKLKAALKTCVDYVKCEYGCGSECDAACEEVESGCKLREWTIEFGLETLAKKGGE